jgi:hypothetical protein
MKKYLRYISIFALILTFGVALPMHMAHAAGFLDIEGSLVSVATDLVAAMVNLALGASAWVLSFAGMLLNFSMRLTLNIKSFVDKTEAIYLVWRSIRDISGMFIIFTLLYAAVKMILGQDAKMGGLIKNIVISAILINFSFFIASIGIDVSNVVSLQLYKAITPQDQMVTLTSNSHRDGGISDIFMQSLKITRIYDPKTGALSNIGKAAANDAAFSPSMKIILIGIVGIMIMITATLSFALAAIAFIFRFVTLLFLLAFSPIWFAAMVVPGTAKYSKEFTDKYVAQLITLPVYLLLMYFAMSVLSSSNFQNMFAGNISGRDDWYSNFMIIGINAVLVIFMLNAPLLAAVSLGGMGKKLTGWAGNVGADKLWAGMGASAYRGTLSRGASAISRSDTLKNIASRSVVGELALKGVRGVAKNYNENVEKQVKERTAFSASLGYNQAEMNDAQSALRTHQAHLARAKAAGLPTGLINTQIRIARRSIASIENRRADDYSRGIENTPAPTSLFMRASRANRVAAAKIQIPILEDRMKQENDTLKGTKDDIKQLQKDIRNNPAGTAGAAGSVLISALGPAVYATAAQAQRLTDLQQDEVDQLDIVNDTQAQIDGLK